MQVCSSIFMPVQFIGAGTILVRMDNRSRPTTPLFPTTDWALIEQCQPVADRPSLKLPELIEKYRPAIRAYLRGVRRLSEADADDAIQGFIASKVVADAALTRASRERGRFRSYLLTMLQRYLIDQHRREISRQRSEAGLAERVADETKDTIENVDVFEIAWARGVLDEAVCRMRTYLEASGRQVLWHVFSSRVLTPILTQVDPPPYEEFVGRFGFETATQACSAVVTARRMLARFVREVISQYTESDAEIEEEIDDLHRILSAAR
jgi:RNA polymerase sigma-70 factor (ECF subfamily)